MNIIIVGSNDEVDDQSSAVCVSLCVSSGLAGDGGRCKAVKYWP